MDRIMEQRWKVYLKRLLSAVIGGAANGITVTMVDPTNFNLFEGGFKKLATVMLVSAIVAVAMYVKQSTIPGLEEPLVETKESDLP